MGQVRPGGKLVILSGNNWTKANTPRNSWLGGFLLNGATHERACAPPHRHAHTHTRAGEPVTTLGALQHAFKRSFALEHVEVRNRRQRAGVRKLRRV